MSSVRLSLSADVHLGRPVCVCMLIMSSVQTCHPVVDIHIGISGGGGEYCKRYFRGRGKYQYRRTDNRVTGLCPDLSVFQGEGGYCKRYCRGRCCIRRNSGKGSGISFLEN